jgi:nucleoside 2-deoxyribosyltransferase
MMKIYLTGPMTGLANYNFPAFDTEAKRLRGMGYEVVSPSEFRPVITDWQKTMCRCIAAMVDCDMLAYLPGWESSEGAILEIGLAKRLGKTIIDVQFADLGRTINQGLG